MEDRQLGIVTGPYLVEEMVEGPEYSVELIVRNGQPRAVAVVSKTTGFAPWFEEMQHVVGPQSAADDDLRDAALAAARALNVQNAIMHVEVRRSSRGPRIIEAAARVGGDLISELVRMTTGIDLYSHAGALALGLQSPEPTTPRSPWAAIRFYYPPTDLIIRELTCEPLDDLGGLEHFVWEARVNEELALPPRGYMSRLGFAVVTGNSADEVTATLNAVGKRIRVNGRCPAAIQRRAHG